MKILILKFGALGDVIRTSYILPGLFDKYNGPTIDWITSSSACDLLRFNPYIRILVCPEVGLKFLESNFYDLVLSFDEEYEVLNLINTMKYKKIIGAYLHDGARLYSDDSAEWFDMGLLSTSGKQAADIKKRLNTREHNQIFEDMLDIQIKEGVFFNSRLIENKISNNFDKHYFNIGINSSAGARWKNKEMPFNEVCMLLKCLLQYRVDNKKIKIHLLGGEMDEIRNRQILENVNLSDIVSWGGLHTLLEFAAIVRGCDYVITSDTLALHLAISQKVPNLSYYAPTSANEIGTFTTGVKVISLSETYCNYSASADNSSITSTRIIDAFKIHCRSLNLPIVP